MEVAPTKRMDRRTPWAVAGYYFFSLAGLAIASPYQPLYWRSQGYDGAALGLLLTAMGLGGLLGQPPMGYLSDRTGRRRELIVVAMGLAGLTMLAFPLYGSLGSMLAATLFHSAAFRSSDALVQALVGDWAEGAGMAAAYGRVRMAGSIGWVLSLLASAQVAGMTDTRLLPGSRWAAPMFLLVGGCYVVAAACILFTPPGRALRTLRLNPVAAVRTVAAAPRIRRFLCAFALMWIGMQSISAFLSLFMKDLGASHRAISMAFAVSAISETPFVLFAGRLADTWGEKRLLLLAFAGMPVRLVLYAVAPSLWWVYPAQAMHSITYGLLIVGCVAFVNKSLPRELRGMGQAALGVVMATGATLSPLLGSLVERTGGYRATFGLMAVVSAVGLVLLAGLPAADPVEDAYAPAS